jgi:hypothetical protein
MQYKYRFTLRIFNIHWRGSLIIPIILNKLARFSIRVNYLKIDEIMCTVIAIHFQLQMQEVKQKDQH